MSASTVNQTNPAYAASEPVQPAAKPSFWRRVGKFALGIGLLGLVIGAAEGLAVGTMLRKSDQSEPWHLILAADRGIVLGLVGVALGAGSGAADWLMKTRRQRKLEALAGKTPQRN